MESSAASSSVEGGATQSAVERTLDLLARSREDAAAVALREALGRRDDLFGVEAALAISRHGSMRLKNEVVRSVATLSGRQKDALRHKARAFADATLHSLSSPEEADRRAAVEWIAAVDDFERFPTLVASLVGSGKAAAEPADVPTILMTCEHLVERMFDLCDGRDALDDAGDRIRNAAELRRTMAAALVEACDSIEQSPCPEQLLEWTLILLDAESPACQRLVTKLPDPARTILLRTLMSGTHPGVMRLAWEMLKRSYPLPIAFDLWRQRRDPEFICHLLNKQPAAPTTLQIQNLQTIDDLPWLAGDETAIDTQLRSLPIALLPGVVSLLQLVSLPEPQQQLILRWLLENGDGPTRAAASEMFDLLSKKESHAIITNGLDHEDIEIQAWATSQLRPQDVPNAIRLLIERLDSDCDRLRDAARSELADFNFSRMVTLIDADPKHVTPAMGRLIQKVDPDSLDHARKELAHAIRSKRLKAVQTVQALGLSETLLPALIALLEDADMLVRRTAAEAIGHVPTRSALVALDNARHDESVRVRETAIAAMQKLRVEIIRRARAEAATVSAEASS